MLETQRLVLRPFEPGDLEAYAAIRSNRRSPDFLPGGEAAREMPGPGSEPRDPWAATSGLPVGRALGGH